MSCNRLSRGWSCRHDHFKAALSRLVHRAGRSSQLEPAYNAFGLADPAHQRARADVRAFLPPPLGLTLLDVSVTHPRCSSYVHAAAASPGATAASRDQVKYNAMSGHALHGQRFVPASVETYGYLGKPLVQFLSQLSEVAAQKTLGLNQGSFLASAYRELSVALVRGQGRVYQMCARLLARASGSEFVDGADVPCLD
jgi:hypothetical protein